MTDALSKGLGAILMFFLGVIFSITSYWIAPEIITLMPSTTLQAICWIGLIVTWVLMIVVVPVWIIISSGETAE